MVQEQRAVADAIVDRLIAHEVTTVFGIPGVQTYSLFEALEKQSEQIRTITARHEQGCAYMALGYAQSTGKTGVFSVVPGPGVLNAGAGIVTALGTSTPVLCLTSEIPTKYIGRGFGHLHELPNQLETLAGITKHADNIMQPHEVDEKIDAAMFAARAGKPGATAVAVPWDVLESSGPATEVRPVDPGEPGPHVDERQIEAVLALIKDSEKPLILVGGGARHAAAEVQEFAEKLNAPVIANRGGLGILPSTHPLSLPSAAGYELYKECDLVITIGTRAELIWFRWHSTKRDPKVVHITIEPAAKHPVESVAAVVADSRDALIALNRELKQRRSQAPAAKITHVRDKVRAEIEEYLQPHVDYLDAIRRQVPSDGFLVEELSQMGFSASFAYEFRHPREFITAGHQGTLGFGFPTALGVKVANPSQVVVSLNGDGGFLFGCQELATAAQYNIAVIAIVFDNGAYGNVKADQERIYGRSAGATLQSPDFCMLAESFGVANFEVNSPAELEKTLEEAIKLDAPVVISVHMPLDIETSPWKFLMPTAN